MIQLGIFLAMKGVNEKSWAGAGMGGARGGPAPEDVAFVAKVLADRGGPAIPLNFQHTAPGYNAHDPQMQRVRFHYLHVALQGIPGFAVQEFLMFTSEWEPGHHMRCSHSWGSYSSHAMSTDST